MESSDFFDFCTQKGLITNSAIAESFMVSSQTIRNWRKLNELPHWLKYAVLAVSNDLVIDKFDFSDFKKWQRDNDVATYEQTGDIFGIKRQAVHQWFRRGRFPNWLSLACAGYNLNH